MPELTPDESIERLSGPAADLAEAVSLAIRIEPQLLRKMRLDLFPAADAGVEADLWFSSIVESRAASGIVLRQPVAQFLRRRLAAKPAALQAAWNVVEFLHRNISPALFAEERLAYLALAGKREEMRDLLRSIIATLVSQRGHRLAGWAATAFGRLPQEARTSEEAQMLAFGASLRLGEPGPTESAPLPAGLADWAGWLAPGDLETLPFGVALLEDAVEFGPAGRSGSHPITLPKTNPVLVELAWHDGTRERTERLALNPNLVSIVELGPGVTEVDIRTVLGDSYWLTVPARRARESTQKKVERARPPRVHITYGVETGGAIEMKELPFVVGVLAALSGHPVNLPGVRNRKFVEIDRDNFDAVLAATQPRLSLVVENRLTAESGSLHLELHFAKMSDFEPASVARQIDGTRQLLHNRTLLSEVHAALTANSKLEAQLESVLAATAQSQGTLNEPSSPLLGAAAREIEESAGVTADRARELVSAFVEMMSSRSASGALLASLSTRIGEIDSSLSGQVREVLHHPDFQALESAWRSLYYLVTQTETSTSLKIRVWNVSKSEMTQDFAGAADFRQSSTFKKIYEEAFGVLGGEPYGVLVGAYEFGPASDDFELLERISSIGASCHAPFLAAASPGMLHLENFSDLRNVADVGKQFESPDASLWNAFRDFENSRYVGLVLPRILLRLPYGKDTVPVEEFGFEEGVSGSDPSHYLWGNAAFALAVRLTAAFATYGWCAAIHGVEGGGLVEGLPAHTFPTDDGDVALQCPTEVAILDRRETELARAGFIPLCWLKATGSAVFWTVNTVQRAPRFESDDAQANARLSLQLPYIFSVSRFAHYLKCMMRDKIGYFMSSQDVGTFLNNWILQYVAADDAASQEIKARYPLGQARIEIEEDQERPGGYRAIAFLGPHYQLEESAVTLRVVIDLPGPAGGPASPMAAAM